MKASANRVFSCIGTKTVSFQTNMFREWIKHFKVQQIIYNFPMATSEM